MEIKGSAALVVGGGSGLGAATARRLAAAGGAVTIADLDAGAAERVAGEVGGRHLAADVRDAAAIEAAVELAAAAAGPGLRVAVCCAGIGSGAKLAGSRGPHPLDAFRQVIEVNLVGTFNVMRLAAAAMLANEPDDGGERGLLVSTASVAAFDGQIGQIAYAASKAGIAGMTLPAARDLAAAGIRAVTIAPGLFDTPLLATLPKEMRRKLGEGVPFPSRLGDPDEYARMVEAVVVNPMLNGETIRLDGALRMAPS